MKKRTVLFFVILILLMNGICAGPAEALPEPIDGITCENLNQKDKVIGVVAGTTCELLTLELFPEAEIRYYENYPDTAIQIRSGAVDAFICDEPMAASMCRELDWIAVLPEYAAMEEYAFAFPMNEEGRALRDQVNLFLKGLRETGELERIRQAWINDDRENQVVDIESLPEVNGVVRLATESAFVPFCFVRDNQIVGLDQDILIRFCREMGYRLEIMNMKFDAVIPSLGHGADMGASAISVTPERAEQVYFSDPYYTGGNVIVVRAKETEKKTGFFESLMISFEKTFIREERWRMIVQGIGTTLYISLCAAFLGTVLGFAVCMLKRCRFKAVRAVTNGYIRILQGTPLVVLLMVLFYAVFAASGISATAVAVLGFAMNFSAYTGEIMRAGIESVDAGQREAAYALGFTRMQTFLRFVMPQAARQFLPVYKGEFISMVKMTSIAGYITVQDLTKMSDIIRSRTYEAFFPLITTAALYFVLAALLGLALNRLIKGIEPKRSGRLMKGVKKA